MHACRSIVLFAGALVSAASIHAQTAPPIKPGLWQLRVEHEGAGAAPTMPDMSEVMKNMPPEQRKQMEAAMKSHGVDASAGAGLVRTCLTREAVSEGRWQGDQGDCQTQVTSRSANAWKWHAVCAQPKSESDGEAVFADAENYTVKTVTTMTMKGEKKTVKNTLRAKWLASDCGDVKPVSPAKRK